MITAYTAIWYNNSVSDSSVIDIEFGIFYKGRKLNNFGAIVAKFAPKGESDTYEQQYDVTIFNTLDPCDVDEVRAYYSGVQVPIKNYMNTHGTVYCPTGYQIMFASLEIDGIHIANLKSSKPLTKQPVGEKPCRNCTRMNDIGSSKCWWCEVGNPV